MEYHSCYRMLLVLSISAKDSSNKVRARERESANPGDGKPLGADVDTVLVTTPFSVHRFVLVRSKLFVFNLLLLGKVCGAGEFYQFVVRIRSIDIILLVKQYLQLCHQYMSVEFFRMCRFLFPKYSFYQLTRCL